MKMIVSIYHKIRTWGLKGVIDYFKRMVVYRHVEMLFYRNARRFPMKPQRGVTVVADLTGQSSLSKAMRDFLFMLRRAGIPYQTFDLGRDKGRIPAADYEGLLTPPGDFRILKYDHFVEMFGGPFPNGLPLKRSRIAFWEFESGLMEYYPAIANGVDEIVVMSDFDFAAFHRQLPNGACVKKILYPFLLDVGKLPPVAEVRSKYGIGSDEFVVFFNFDFGSSYARKHPDGVVRAFAAALRGVSNARLVFKTKSSANHPDDMANLQSLIDELGIADQVTFINTFITMKDIYGLTNACDVYISLHRGEGFGLGVAEAMFLSKPVIVTDYGATTEFCSVSTSIPVPYVMVKVSSEMHDHACYRAVTEWAEADVNAAAKALRKLYDQPAVRASLGNAAKTFITDHFSLDNFRRSIDNWLDGQ